MQTQEYAYTEAGGNSPVPSVAHIVRIIRGYLPVIGLGLAMVALAYAMVAVGVYLFAPSERVISLPFRLDFSGITAGKYPNGAKFTTNDIINPPILLEVYQTNSLKRYAPFAGFARSIYVIEHNPEYERLEAEYQGRLADAKLSPIDRERIEKEYQAKREGLSKNDYAINYVVNESTRRIPDALARKVLADVLSAWAQYASVQQKALSYDVPVLSPSFLDQDPAIERNLVSQVVVLRSKIRQVLANADVIGDLPAVNLIRTKDGMSLAEIVLRLQEVQRFRLEPLATEIQTSGLITDRPAEIGFVATQLEYDQRRLNAAQQKASAIRDSLTAYAQGVAQPPQGSVAQPSLKQSTQAGETVMPQMTDSFLDRLMQLTNVAADQQYREKMVDALRAAADDIVPLQEAVDYDTRLLNSLRTGGTKTGTLTQTQATLELDSSRKVIRDMTGELNEIYRGASETLNPSMRLFTVTAPPITSLKRGVSLPRLMAYGLLLLLVTFPALTIGCLVHNRMRQEDAGIASLPRREEAV